MKKKSFLLPILVLSLVLPAAADTFKLKDGTSLEGTIISEEGDSYLIEVQVTKTIKDERKVLKEDVAKVTRESPEDKAFVEIEKLVPTPDLMTDEEYGERITAVSKFLKDFPSSDNAKKANEMLATLKEESTQVASGGIKVNGALVTPAEYKVNAYDLDAKVKEAQIRRYLAAYQYLTALRLFSDFTADYQGTTAFTALAPVILQVMKGQVAEAKQLLATFDARVNKRNLGLERMSADDRRGTENAIAEEDAAIEARLKAEKDNRIAWVSPHPFSKTALEEVVRSGEAEIARLGTVKPALGMDGGKAWREAYAMIRGGGGSTAVSTAIAAARTAGVSAKYMAILEEAAKPSR
jgi:hypothetical protein